ncbi:MAG: lysylphosphatidylglycerol synthase transmembrane domain-containing protein [Candidatus Neomarinimicrobiota bacterium]
MKKLLSNFLKIGITVFLFWWLSRSVEIGELLAYFKSIPRGLVLAIFSLGLLNVAGQALRFYTSVHFLMPAFTAKQLVVSHFSGFALRLILPASMGEVGKVFMLPGNNKTRIYTFLLDAFYCTATNLFFFGIACFLLYPQMWYMLGFCLVFIVFFWIYRLLVRTTNFKKHIPDTVPYFKFGLANISFSIFTMVVYVAQYWVLLKNFGMSLFDTAKASIFILGVGYIPLSFAGMGFRENGAQYVLANFGVSSHVAVGTAMLVFSANVLFPALIGVIMLTFVSDIKLRDIRAMVKKKEQESKDLKRES